MAITESKPFWTRKQEISHRAVELEHKREDKTITNEERFELQEIYQTLDTLDNAPEHETY